MYVAEHNYFLCKDSNGFLISVSCNLSFSVFMEARSASLCILN